MDKAFYCKDNSKFRRNRQLLLYQDIRFQRQENIVSRTLVQDDSFSFLNRTQLERVKLKAIRAGVWFRALPKIDRALVDLTIKVADSVRSAFLAQRILLVARKLESFLESKFSRAVREVGLPLVRKLSLFAQQWGNISASEWADDVGFARYWAVMLNGQTLGFRG